MFRERIFHLSSFIRIDLCLICVWFHFPRVRGWRGETEYQILHYRSFWKSIQASKVSTPAGVNRSHILVSKNIPIQVSKKLTDWLLLLLMSRLRWNIPTLPEQHEIFTRLTPSWCKPCVRSRDFSLGESTTEPVIIIKTLHFMFI